jgi:hypothetical protein
MLLRNCASAAMAPMRAKHCFTWIVIRNLQLAGRGEAGTFSASAKVVTQIAG